MREAGADAEADRVEVIVLDAVEVALGDLVAEIVRELVDDDVPVLDIGGVIVFFAEAVVVAVPLADTDELVVDVDVLEDDELLELEAVLVDVLEGRAETVKVVELVEVLDARGLADELLDDVIVLEPVLVAVDVLEPVVVREFVTVDVDVREDDEVRVEDIEAVLVRDSLAVLVAVRVPKSETLGLAVRVADLDARAVCVGRAPPAPRLRIFTRG